MKANSNRRVDDIMSIMLHGVNTMLKFPECPAVLKANNGLQTFFEDQEWDHFTMENGLDTICHDAVQFVQRNIYNRARNVCSINY